LWVPGLPFFVVVKIGSFFIFRIYKMTWRYVGLYDLLSIFAATVIATSLLMLSVILPVDLPLSGFSKGVVLADGVIALSLASSLCLKPLMDAQTAGSRLF
jgi:FlaA1/EpsC-like NDP-sugar epimerase